MAALGTNVLVRYLVRDDEAQFKAARRLIRQSVKASQALYVPVTVALELEWVLRSNFGMSKTDVSQVLASLLATAELNFESEGALELALRSYVDGKADYADCVHAALAARAGVGPLWTFDRTAARLDGARLLPS